MLFTTLNPKTLVPESVFVFASPLDAEGKRGIVGVSSGRSVLCRERLSSLSSFFVEKVQTVPMEIQTSGKSIDSVLERVLCMNILSSDYFKELHRLKTYHEVIDEIYNQVDHVEPWMTGNCRGPSTAFCLLYKFFTMKLTVKQMQGVLNHGDSPYIRAVGFLYLRYVGDSKSLWGWFEEYITDEEEFSPGSNSKTTTMGLYVRDLLLDQYYFDTLFPRIPVPVMRQIVSNLKRLKLSTQPAGVTATGSRHSTDDTARRPPSVKAALSVSFGQRAPHRASTRDFSPVRRGVSNSRDHQSCLDDQRCPQNDSKEHKKEKTNDRENPSRNREWERIRDLDRSGERSKSDRERLSGREEDRKRTKVSDRSRGRDREFSREKYLDRDWESSSKEREGRKDWDEKETDKHRHKMRDWSLEQHSMRDKESRRPHREADRIRYESPQLSGGDVNHYNGGTSLSSIDKLRNVYGTSTDVNQVINGGSTAKEEPNDDVICLGGPTWR